LKLHGLARVKNEGDVIEEFVRHNLSYLDALTVVDNASFDGTLPVLEALRAEGLAVTILHDPLLPKRQYETVTRVARQSAAESDWDFLFLLDADEFVKVTDRNALEGSLAALSPGQNGRLSWLTYVPTPRDPADVPRVLERIRHRRLVEASPAYTKCVLSRGYAQRGDFAISQGNHYAFDARGTAPSELLADAALAHFPVRSLAQIQGKVLLGWGAYLAMGHDGVGMGMGWHQRRLFDKLESAPAWSDDDVYEIALNYADDAGTPTDPTLTYDPLAPVPIWRYGNAAILNPMQLAAGYVRQLAGSVARHEATSAQQA
jgi:hypothetical protein